MNGENRTTLEIIAPTVDEAIERGLAELNLPREAVTIEVLDTGSKGLLGIGGRQARVRLTVSTPARQPEAAPTPAQAEVDLLTLTRRVVADLLEKMNVVASPQVEWKEIGGNGAQAIYVNMRGNDLGILIGRRAEILNAFQYLVNLIVGRQAERWVQIIVDVEGYRSRRERQLRQLARRLADQAVKTGRRQVLEPMSAAERRIIHLELRDHPAVTTQSIGEEPGRKVVIIPKNVHSPSSGGLQV